MEKQLSDVNMSPMPLSQQLKESIRAESLSTF
jgi:hypothetical protein